MDSSRMFQGTVQCVLRNIQGSCCFMRVWRVLKGRLKSVLRVYQDYFIVFKGYFKEVSKMVQSSFRGASRLVQGNLKKVLQ